MTPDGEMTPSLGADGQPEPLPVLGAQKATPTTSGQTGRAVREIVETLLLAEPLAQTDYFRSLASLSELGWRLTRPAFPDVSLPRTRLTLRERVVTAAFVLSVIGALALIAWAVRTQTE